MSTAARAAAGLIILPPLTVAADTIDTGGALYFGRVTAMTAAYFDFDPQCSGAPQRFSHDESLFFVIDGSCLDARPEGRGATDDEICAAIRNFPASADKVFFVTAPFGPGRPDPSSIIAWDIRYAPGAGLQVQSDDPSARAGAPGYPIELSVADKASFLRRNC